MKYILFLMFIAYAVTGWSYFWAKGEGDNFGAVVVPLIGGGVSVMLTLAYVAVALWLHRGW